MSCGNEILQNLNKKQLQAVTHSEGAILVNAAPGTGKTRVITHRIAYLIQHHGVPPDQILAVTFTNKAAQEMLNRTRGLVGPEHGQDFRIHTFHGFCVDLLRDHATEIGLRRNFAIFDEESQEDVLRECLREAKINQLDYEPRWLRNIIGKYKVNSGNPLSGRGKMPKLRRRDGAVIDDLKEIQRVEDLIKAYQSKLVAKHALDFDDIIWKAVESLENTVSVRNKVECQIRYILVDEYQDVNPAQYALLKLVCPAPEQNLMVVADEDQSIYSWRGSSREYVKKFKDDFRPTVVELKKHYRCSGKILDAAQSVILKNIGVQKNDLKTDGEPGQKIYHYRLDDSEKEAAHIIKVIQMLVDQGHCNYGEIAVFYRQHKLADALASTLAIKGIGFQRVKPQNSFHNTSAKDISSYLNFIQWQQNRDLERAINFPRKIVDDLTLVRMKWLAERDGITLVDLLRTIEDYQDDVGPLTRRKVRQFLQDVDGFSSEIEGKDIDSVVSRLFDLLERRRSAYHDEDIQKIESAEEVPNLRLAAETLYDKIRLDNAIRIGVLYGIDTHCAAQIIQLTSERYFGCDVMLELLHRGEDIPENIDTEIDILIGDFEELPRNSRAAIVIGDITEECVAVVQLGRGQAPDRNLVTCKSVIALKLCQQILTYVETPNCEGMIVYDLETTSKDSKQAEIVELAASRLDSDGNEVERRCQLVKPPHPIPKSSTQVHHIDNALVKNKPSIQIVLPKFLDFIQDSVLIGHNVEKFDNLVLERSLKKLDIGLSNLFYDTLTAAQELFPSNRRSLEALTDEFGIAHATMHRAMEDVEVNRQVLRRLVKIKSSRHVLRSLDEFLPFVGVGILANQSEMEQVEQSDDSGYANLFSGQTQSFLQAATRYVQSHQPKLDNMCSYLESAEVNRIGGCLQKLEQESISDFMEDTHWNSNRENYVEAVHRFQRNSTDTDVSSFCYYQKLIYNVDELEFDANKINLMTVHAAKGTEFRVVIITGMEQRNFPIVNGKGTSDDIEEERRLFYVGMTRAKERLYLSSVVRRDRTASRSMFINEIPSDLIEHWPRDNGRG